MRQLLRRHAAAVVCNRNRHQAVSGIRLDCYFNQRRPRGDRVLDNVQNIQGQLLHHAYAYFARILSTSSTVKRP